MTNIIIGVLLTLVIVLTGFIFLRRPSRPDTSELASLQQHLSQNLSTQFQNQERHLTAALQRQTETTGQKLTDLQTRLAVIDKAQQSLSDLSAQTTRLEHVLSNKQARGAYGEMQLENLVQQVLPPNAYEFQALLSNGTRPDCLLKLPSPPGSIVIDSKFPLEAFYALGSAADDVGRALARKALGQALIKHVTDISSKYIIAGETADSAILFLPSEAVYSEFYTNLTTAVEASFKHRVYIASPTTLMATLNTIRAILRDVKMREHAAVIQLEVGRLLDDVGRLDSRVGNLKRHFDQAQKDIDEITTSTAKITSKGKKIDQFDLATDEAAAAVDFVPPPKD